MIMQKKRAFLIRYVWGGINIVDFQEYVKGEKFDLTLELKYLT